MTRTRLPSWRRGSTREAVEDFLDAAEMLPVDQRVAVFDVDGTLWCERPQYPMVDFLLHALRQAVEDRPALAERAEYQAALAWDEAAIARLGPVNVVLALVELHTGITPEAFAELVRRYAETARHPELGSPLSRLRYRPMLELIAELRARLFSVYLVTGGGAEFVRAISQDFFGVLPEGVVGSQVGYELDHGTGTPRLLRTRELFGDPNEGAAKVVNIQRMLGRRPILAAGNSAGDAAMLAYAQAFGGPSLSLLLDHDDAEREYAYQGAAGTFDATEPITTTARRAGWHVVSMRHDWSVIFADA